MLNKRWLVLVLILSLAIFAVSCGDDDDDDDPAVDEFEVLSGAGDTYFTDYTTVGGTGVNTTMDTVFGWLTDGNDDTTPFIIDWRGADDFAAGHIVGAVNWSLGDLADKFDDLPTDKLILNVCYTGQSASFATSTMNLLAQDPDYSSIEAVNLKFGMCSVTTDINFIPKTDKWETAIADDEFSAWETTANDLTAEYDFPTIDTGKDDIADILKDQFSNAATSWTVPFSDVINAPDDYFVVNYWPADRYLDPGHIPGAYNLPPGELTVAGSLKYLPTDKTIVPYCYTGQTSAQVTAYLRALGYDAKSLLYGANGFAYQEISGRGWPNYHASTNDFSGVITTGAVASN